jgi:OmcA/MtrC family decaheme c-type cytochrome
MTSAVSVIVTMRTGALSSGRVSLGGITLMTLICRVLAALLLASVIGACSGKKGDPGPAGPPGPSGPAGPPGTSLVPDVTSARTILAEITTAAVSSAGTPVVRFRLLNEQRVGLSGLQAAQISFVVARLAAGTSGRSSAWRAYTTRTEQPGPVGPGTTPQLQATTEPGTGGQLVDNRDGTYQYTFAKNITNDATIPYDASLTHRVGFEIRGLQATVNNPTYTFQPSSAAIANIFSREVIDNDTCNACHDQLEFHGGARFDTKYCVACHNPSSTDAQSGNSVDMAVMIHKIHLGNKLPSVVAGGRYQIYGFRNTLFDYSSILFTQDVRNCTTCHQESDTDTPQASNWRQVANSEKCGSCHDDVNFTTGAGHATGIAANDQDCLTCHGPSGLVATIDRSHELLEFTAARRFRYEVLGVTNTAPGQRPTATIRVSDPTNNNAPYDITTNQPPFRVADRAAVTLDIAWTNAEFRNNLSGSAPSPVSGTPAQPIRMVFVGSGSLPLTRNADGSFTATSALPIPASGVTGSGTAALEGRPALDVDPDLAGAETLSVPGVTRAFAITDATATARRSVVEIQRCNDCHKQLSLHGDNRTDNTELCATCHNPNATDINRRVAGSACVTQLGTNDAPIDLKYMVHAIHAGSAASYTVCGFGNTPFNFSTVKYPGKLNNCEGCHRPGTYYPTDSPTRLATSFDAGADRSTAADDVAVSPNTTACFGCHKSTIATEHMRQNGGSFTVTKNADGTTAAAPTETCALCHGPGRSSDVRVVHGVIGNNPP